MSEVRFYGPALQSGGLLTWDSGNPSNGAVIDPASGTWNTLAGNVVWNDGGSNFSWMNGSGASFGGADGSYAVTVGESLSVSSLGFAVSGYALSSTTPASITLAGGLDVASGKSAAIAGNVSILFNSNSAFVLSNSGTLNIGAGATVAKTGTNNLLVSGTGTVNVAGTLSRSGNGTGSNSLRIGAVAGDDVTLNIPTGGIVTHLSANNRIEIGQGGKGRVNVQGGTLQATGGGAILVGASGTKGTLNVTGGTVSSINDIVVGNVAEGVLSVSGGTANVTGTTGQRLVVAAGGPATVDLSGFGVVDVAGTAGVHFGSAAASTGAGVINLDGGTLKVPKISKLATQPGASTILNFNGGTLKATAGGSAFMEGLDAANVGNGGALIDTNGFDITIGQTLVHGILANAKDGGLTKSGAGTLTLSSPNTYAGDTRVIAGELALGSASLNDDSDVHLSPGANLRLAHGTSDTVHSLFLNGVRAVRGVYVPAGSVEAGVPTAGLTGVSGSLVVVADDFDDWAANLPAGMRGREDDADGDGFSNLAEFLFGTQADTGNGSLTTISNGPSGMILRWMERDNGAVYQIQESTDAVHWAPGAFIPTLSDQTGVPAGYTCRQVIVPFDIPTRMIRVRAVR